MRRGEVEKSRTGRTFYAVTGYTPQADGSVRIFVQGRKGFVGLIRQPSLARRIKTKLTRGR